MNYLSQEISDLTAFLTTREKESLYEEFCGGARYSAAGETTIVTTHEAVRKIKTIYYTTRKLLPARNGKGQDIKELWKKEQIGRIIIALPRSR